jgi:hypothetical protein
MSTQTNVRLLSYNITYPKLLKPYLPCMKVRWQPVIWLWDSFELATSNMHALKIMAGFFWQPVMPCQCWQKEDASYDVYIRFQRWRDIQANTPSWEFECACSSLWIHVELAWYGTTDRLLSPDVAELLQAFLRVFSRRSHRSRSCCEPRNVTRDPCWMVLTTFRLVLNQSCWPGSQYDIQINRYFMTDRS